MKYGKIYNFFNTALLIPLWLGLLTDIIKDNLLLKFTAFIISTLLLLLSAVFAVHEFLQMIDASYKYQCWKMDRLVSRARKKLAKKIARTNDASVMDYAAKKLCEVCQPEIYAGILAGLAEKERDPGRKQTLLFYSEPNSEQIGGNK